MLKLNIACCSLRNLSSCVTVFFKFFLGSLDNETNTVEGTEPLRGAQRVKLDYLGNSPVLFITCTKTDKAQKFQAEEFYLDLEFYFKEYISPNHKQVPIAIVK